MIHLKELVGSIIESFLGPNKSNKFIIQEKDSYIVRCPLYIFQNTAFQDPLSSLVEETLFAHHDLYGCSTLSLLAMWYLWNEEFRLALEEGCEIQNIIKYSQDILEQAISAASDISFSIDKMIFKENSLQRTANKFQGKKVNNFNKTPISIQYSSRHFSPSQVTLNSDDDVGCDKDFKLNESCLKTIIQSLDHDEDPEICDLVLKCWKKQLPTSNCFKFKTEGLLICPIVLPCSSSRVVDGLVIKSNLNHSYYQDASTNRIVIINGSITYKYVHLGFSPKISISLCQTSMINRKEIWRKQTCEFLKQLNLNVLLVKDDIDPEIASFCSAHSVLVLDHIPLKAFRILCNALQYSPCVYIWDCQEENIIKNLKITNWKPSDDITLNDQYFLISIMHLKNTFQTIMLCHPSQAVSEKSKHQVNHFLSRLSTSFDSNKLLPGEGESEKWCSEFLRKQPFFGDSSEPASRIATALINGFHSYSTIILRKKSICAEKVSKILDEMSSKFSAWRSALSLVLLTLQSDTVIINDLSDLGTTNCCITTL